MDRTVAAPANLDLRPFDPERDFPGAVDLISAVNAHDRSQDWFPTVESLQVDWKPNRMLDPTRDAIVVEDAGRLVAGGIVDWRQRAGKIIHTIEIWVRPEVRRQGLGTRLLDRLETRARASIEDGTSGPAELPHFLGGGTDVADAASVGFAARAGYEPVRYGFQMRRSLGGTLPDAPIPPGLEIRPVLPEHIRAIWEGDVEAFRDHFEPREKDESDFVRFTADPDCDTSMWVVGWAGDQVAGGVLNGIYPNENASTGEELGWHDHVFVRRPWRGQGLAKALITRSMRVLRQRGMTVAALGVDAENPTGALQLYEGLGFAPHRRWATVRKPL
jgi:GNAT superfamily N-acetyltransferase